MDVKVTHRDPGVSIVVLEGRITAGDALTAFRNQIRDEIAKGHNKILLDLKEVSYIDSSGLGELVLALGTVTQTICADCGSTLFKDDQGQWERCHQCNSTSRKAWGQLKLANPGRQVTDLLHFTKLNTVFDVHETQADAIASFS
jgi:anti-sigma B factor antagonist